MVQGVSSRGGEKVIAGLTGVFGSGKTAVGFLFKELGAFVIDADVLAHEALASGSGSFSGLARAFPGCVKPDGSGLDRKKLAGIVFADAAKRKQLESVVHPYVFQRMNEEIAKSNADVVIAEVPLLFESGFDRYFQLSITVSAPEDVIFERLRSKGFEPETVRARWEAQLPLAEKAKKADIVIDNSKSLNETKRQVEEIWNNRLSSRKEP